MPFLNFTQDFGNVTQVYTNVSSTIANQPPGMTTQTVWLFFVAVAIVLLIVSRLDINGTAKDLAGALSSAFMLISAIQSFAVDVISDPVVVPGNSPVIGVVLETHTIYHYDLIGVVLGLCSLISLANLYLLWLDAKKPMNQERGKVDAPKWGNPSTGNNLQNYEEDEDDE